MIISASRRTDIPAFYAEWFTRRLQEGFLYTRNPFNANQVKTVSLQAKDVDAIVFWTRNPEKLIPKLGLLDSLGYRYYFQYTITGYPRALEKSVPRPQRAIDTFCNLSDLIGPGRVVWRYDPILLSNIVDLDEHKRVFEKLAHALRHKTKRVVVSFSDLYKKTERNLKAVPGLIYSDILHDYETLEDLMTFFADVASENEIEIQSCAEDVDLSKFGIDHGKCIDDQLLKEEFGIIVSSDKDEGQREACGCVKSIDIGQYNTCLHGCTYCYATFNAGAAVKNIGCHDPSSPFLIGPPPTEQIVQFVRKDPKQDTLF